MRVLITFAIGLAGLNLAAQDQELFRKEMEVNILQLHRGSGKYRGARLVAAFPALPFDSASDPRQQEGRARIAGMLDSVPMAELRFSPSGRTVGDVYAMVLRFKQTPEIELKAEARKQLEEAKRVLFRRRCLFDRLFGLHKAARPSKQYSAYRIYRDAFEAADAAYQYLLMTPADSDSFSELLARASLAREQALAAWTKSGYRASVERATDYYDRLTSYDPRVWWNRLEEQFKTAAETLPNSSRFQSTTTNPPFSQLAENTGWRQFTVPGLSAGGLSVSMDLKEAAIVRPWLEPLVFTSRQWRWTSSLANRSLISNGGDGVSTSWDGMMPLLPVSIVLVRNVRMTGGTPQDRETFGLTEGVEVRILGWMCEVLQRSPYPDPALDWRPPLAPEDLLGPKLRLPANSRSSKP
jgi:hypothetical protein